MIGLSRYNYPNDPATHTDYPKYVHKRDADGKIIIDADDPLGKRAKHSVVVNDPEEEARVEAELNPKPAPPAKATKSSEPKEPNIPPFPSSQNAPQSGWNK